MGRCGTSPSTTAVAGCVGQRLRAVGVGCYSMWIRRMAMAGGTALRRGRTPTCATDAVERGSVARQWQLRRSRRRRACAPFRDSIRRHTIDARNYHSGWISRIFRVQVVGSRVWPRLCRGCSKSEGKGRSWSSGDGLLGAKYNTTMVPLMSLGGGHGFADPTSCGARAISSARTIWSRAGQNAQQNSQCRLICLHIFMRTNASGPCIFREVRSPSVRLLMLWATSESAASRVMAGVHDQNRR